MIVPDSMVLERLRRNGIPYVLAYPERRCKDEYKDRFIRRGNTDEFLNIFIHGWDRFMDSYENTYCTSRLVLKSGEFLTLDMLKAIAAAFPKSNLDLNMLYSVTNEELETELDRILVMVEIGYSPILIKTDGKPDLLLFGWDDYMERCGALYSKKEVEKIQELCKNHSEVDS